MEKRTSRIQNSEGDRMSDKEVLLPYEIISLVLKNSTIHKAEYEDGRAPTFYLGVDKIGEVVKEIGALIDDALKKRIENGTK